jgi:MscS family membrane protein
MIHSAIYNLKLYAVPAAFFALGLGLVLVALLTREKIARKVANYLAEKAKISGATWNPDQLNSVKAPISFLILMLSGWGAVKILLLGEKKLAIGSMAATAGQVVVTLLIGWMLFRLIKVFESDLKSKAQGNEYHVDTHLLPVVSIGLKTALFIGVSIVVAHTLGYSVSAIIASLGIGGVAVALAAKDTLANFFGSIALMTDRPFRIGDWVKGPNLEGNVEEIGFRSTKIRTDEKSVLVVPNDKLASMVVENLDRRKDAGLGVRRVHFIIGLEYKARSEKIKEAVDFIRDILAKHPKVTHLNRFVSFYEIGEQALNLQVNFFIKTTEQEEYLRVREEINFKILKKLEELDLRLSPRLATANPFSQPQSAN